MNIFSGSYTDFVKSDRKPNEDFFLASNKYPIFALADGVTQSHFLSGDYAYPAGAKAAAEIFCNSTVGFLEKSFVLNKLDWQKKITESFDFANELVKDLNVNEGMSEDLDYAVRDYFDTVGVAGFLENGVLYYGFVGDCGLAIFDDNNKLKFKTEDMVGPAKERAEKKYPDFWKMPKNERTALMHKEFRNSPDGQGYGSFSGEDGVKKYYRLGKYQLVEKDIVVFYSDGLNLYLEIPEFVELLRQADKKRLDEFIGKKAKESPEKYGDDRTFISFIFSKNDA